MNSGVCSNCGGIVSNNQRFCNTCGLQLNNNFNNNISINYGINNSNISSKMGKLILSRQKKIYGFAVGLTVIINGCTYYLSNGSRYEFDLMPGIYTVTWKFWCRRDKSIQINVMPGNYYCIDYCPDYFWGGFKLSDRCKFQ